MFISVHFTSAGVPTNDPTTPAAIPKAAFMKKPGGFPSELYISPFQISYISHFDFEITCWLFQKGKNRFQAE